MVTLAEEDPFAAAVNSEDLGIVCSSCFKLQRNPALLRCVGCQVLHYCNKQCQKKDWVNHKNECRFLKESPFGPPTGVCRMIARVALKLDRSDAQDAAFNGRRFEDLMDHCEKIRNDTKQMINYGNISQVLKIYTGEKFYPEETVLFSIYGKCSVNAFGMFKDLKSIGSALYIGLSAHNHSCAPDAHVVFEGSKAILRSPNKDLKYSKDLTVSYIPRLAPKSERQGKLSSQYYFTCTCSVCSHPTKDFLYNCARSTCCADSFCLLDTNASELKCFKCGTPSKITVKEAIAANQEAVYICLKINEEKKSTTDSNELYNRFLRRYEKFSKVLSPFNVNLLRITEELFQASSALGNYAVCHKYAPDILAAHRLHRSVGDPILTHRLMCIAAGFSRDPKPTKSVKNLLDEAHSASLVSHGPKHSQMRDINNARLDYTMRLLQVGNS